MVTTVLITVLQIGAVAFAGGCWWTLNRRHGPRWLIAVVGAIALGAAIMLGDADMLFYPAKWSHNKRSLDTYILQFLCAVSIGLLPGLLIIGYSRKKAQTVIKKPV
jgi:hypothetical protein